MYLNVINIINIVAVNDKTKHRQINKQPHPC